ncbi:MAG: hypothetical protein K8R88_07170, partial [Armatimonadetes bacterium]|nr:hypothetical protein [Armatimonadota bacterium]
MIVALVAMGALLFAPFSAPAVNYTWTNSTADSTGYWTNGILWKSTVNVYPGSASGDSAFLTNQFSGSATNILNFQLSPAISTLAISNSLGEMWLIVTNGFSARTVLTNSTFALGDGGRLQIDNGGVVTGITAFTWSGTSGQIYLNSGGRLVTANALTIGSGGVSARVTSASGPGNGGVWDFNNRILTIGGVTAGNVLAIDSGAVLSNLSGLTISGNQNSLLVTNGGKLFGKGQIFYSGSGNTIVMGDGVWDANTNVLGIGNNVNSSNNTFIGGGTLTNVVSIAVGNFAGANNNTLIITNGGLYMSAIANNLNSVLIGGGVQSAGGNNNLVIISNSVLRSGTGVAGGAPIALGWGSSNNTLTLLNNTSWDVNNQGASIGGNVNGSAAYTARTASNVFNVSGAIVSNVGVLAVGYGAVGVPTSFIGISNQVNVINGGVLSNVSQVLVGGNNTASSYNSLIVTGGP